MLSETASDHADKTSGAASRIQAGPVPDWVSDRAYDPAFKARPNDHITHLLFDRQVHAERRESFFHAAIRLETMDAVQKQSQWRLEFEPQTQSIVLHFIRIRRDQAEFEQLNVQKGRLLDREEELNHFVIQGWVTFLLILDDIRPGDILEFAYTVVNTPRLLPENSFYYCAFPAWVPLGKYRFSVRFSPDRPMKWKSFWNNLKPMESNEDGLTRWTWLGENYAGLKPEPKTPAWYLSSPYVQVSDCADWSVVAGAIHRLWSAQVNEGQLEELAVKIEQETTDVPLRIEKAIQFIQDEFRYLSVNLEFGGQIPTSPDVVARRRYGDCKDLSFLLANLLNRLGITARPILVHTVLTKTIGELLPAPIFNHAILEFEADGQRRWIDPTMKFQGGGAFDRPVNEYGFGLPVAANVIGLVEAPKKSRQPDLYELHETFLLDTTGGDSLLAAVTRAVGSYAETLRRQFAHTPLEEIAKERLQTFVNRYGVAKRVGSLLYRDDRAANQFLMVDVFEINRCFQPHQRANTISFPVPNWWLRSTLPIPEKGERKSPFALPFPSKLVHIVDIEFPAFQPPLVKRHSVQDKFLKFDRGHKVGHNFWVMTFSLEMVADAVLPDEIEKYRESAEEIWKASNFVVLLPLGYSRVRKKKGFGELPAVPRPRIAPPSAPVPQPASLRPKVAPTITPVPVPAIVEPAQKELLPHAETVVAKPPAEPAPAPAPKSEKRSRHEKKPKAGFWQRLFGS